MSTSNHKRRLELMPEVLPAPVRTSALPTSSVRARTLARLRVLAAIGAGVAAACSGKTETTGGGSSSGGNNPDGGLPDANRPDSNDPYGVVDPLPRPACFDYAAPPTATASYMEVGDAGIDAGSGSPSDRFVRLLVKWNQSGVAAGSVTVQNGTEVSAKADVQGIDLLLRVAANEPSASVSIETSCPKGPTRLTVSLQLQTDTVQASVSFYGE